MISNSLILRGCSGGAKVLGKLPVPGRPTNLDSSRAWACYACSGCGWGLFGHFFLSSIIFLFFLPFSARYRLKYCLKGPLNPHQPTNTYSVICHFGNFSVESSKIYETKPSKRVNLYQNIHKCVIIRA